MLAIASSWYSFYAAPMVQHPAAIDRSDSRHLDVAPQRAIPIRSAEDVWRFPTGRLVSRAAGVAARAGGTLVSLQERRHSLNSASILSR